MKGNKGITPMVSTIMLFVFAIGLGIMVMSWGNSDKFESYQACSGEISITKISEKDQVCIAEGNLYATIQNDAQTTIEELKIVMLTSETSLSKEYVISLPPGEIRKIRTEVADNKVLKVRFIPDGCVKASVETEQIGVCA